MQSTGVFTTLKIENLITSEQLPHVMFDLLLHARYLSDFLNLIFSKVQTTFERELKDGKQWADIVATDGSAIQLIEWKNISLDYVYIANGNHSLFLLQLKRTIVQMFPKQIIEMLPKS
jgi:hypothetical protein